MCSTFCVVMLILWILATVVITTGICYMERDVSISIGVFIAVLMLLPLGIIVHTYHTVKNYL